MGGGGEVGAAGVLPVVQGSVGRPLQRGQVAAADDVRRRGADRGGEVDRTAVVQGDRRVQHPDRLLQAVRAAFDGQLQDDRELFSELPEAARQLPVNQWHFRGRTS
ncbi:hypothetical protein ACFRFL_43855 [Streptomyces sp. NPDC056708]|uniref:hypothetical protein n=1 Tax=unclassified Streptomyces TaxID=2593676 RepID=UPI003692E3D3